MALDEKKLIAEARAEELQTIRYRIMEITSEFEQLDGGSETLHQIYSRFCGDFFDLAISADNLRKITSENSRAYIYAKAATTALDAALNAIEEIFKETDTNA